MSTAQEIHMRCRDLIIGLTKYKLSLFAEAVALVVEVKVWLRWIEEEVKTVNIVDFQETEKRNRAVIPKDKFDVEEGFIF